MKILMLAPEPFFQERGTPMAVRLLVETLCDFGHQVDLLVYFEGLDIVVPGLRLYRTLRPFGIWHVPIGMSLQKLICDVCMMFSMIGLLLRNRYAVIHAVEEAVFPAALISLFSRHKLIYDMDSSLSDQLTEKWRCLRPLQALLSVIERAAVKRSTVVLAVCEDLAAKVRAWKDPRRIVVLPDIPMGESDPSGPIDSLRDIAGSDAVVGLYVGNLEPYQGIDLLIDALALIPREVNFQMLVVGGRLDHIQHYRARAHQRKLSDRLHFLGVRPVAHLNAYLQQADVLVSPRTLGQNTPMKVYSYMQSGKAILATDIRSHRQALDASCAELAAPVPAAFAQGLLRLAEDRALREHLGQAAHDKVERDYSLPVFRARLKSAYKLIASA